MKTCKCGGEMNKVLIGDEYYWECPDCGRTEE
jgi:hypothetical protein